ncbi:hypothetical protein ElyMa_006205800 [Elysia marginata]|uniref:Resistance to inhibitors of cholinesterase protein 3 N-terminal domain-containing protein n=1 Tax=Elysia marginata TaxID=1093978 RepID=A0AAV4H6E8_9GAST|nr:hypothetical protein ElyMa_006205800 [Elysia marginata]
MVETAAQWDRNSIPKLLWSLDSEFLIQSSQAATSIHNYIWPPIIVLVGLAAVVTFFSKPNEEIVKKSLASQMPPPNIITEDNNNPEVQPQDQNEEEIESNLLNPVSADSLGSGGGTEGRVSGGQNEISLRVSNANAPKRSVDVNAADQPNS